MVQFTKAAAEQLKAVLEEDEIVRVAVKGGGCSGMSYSVTVETEIDDDDILLDVPGVKVYVDFISADILSDTTIDYVRSLQQEGFVFNNPLANTTCGCGASFS